MADLIKFNDDHTSLEEPTDFEDQSEYVSEFTQPMALLEMLMKIDRLIEAEGTEGFDSGYFAALAFDKDIGSTRGIDAVLQEHKLDALVLPSTGFTTVPAGGFINRE